MSLGHLFFLYSLLSECREGAIRELDFCASRHRDCFGVFLVFIQLYLFFFFFMYPIFYLMIMPLLIGFKGQVSMDKCYLCSVVIILLDVFFISHWN